MDREVTDVFLHIPKTAGSTLEQVLLRQYPARKTLYIPPETPDYEAFEMATNGAMNGARLIYGHFRFGIDVGPSHRLRYFTMLRDPVERIISHYYYVLAHPEHRVHETVVSKRMTLKDYIESDVSGEIENGQTALLAGVGFSVPSIRSDALETAKDNLMNRFSVLGVTESFNLSLILFRQVLGWKSGLYYRSANVTRDRPSRQALDPATLAAIVEKNALDRNLYAFAKQQFNREVSTLPLSQIRLRQLQVQNAAFNALPAPAVNALRPVLQSVRRSVFRQPQFGAQQETR